ncbi:unnamed protein product [Parajaminaea phylloscopi]
MEGTHGSPGTGAAKRPMKQSALNFKPASSARTGESSAAASRQREGGAPIEPLVNAQDEESSDDDVGTPPLSSREDRDLLTPPIERKPKAGGSNARPISPVIDLSNVSDGDSLDDDDDDDDDLSDPPPLAPSPLKGKAKVLTKKRPANGASIFTAKKAKQDGDGAQGLLCHQHRADCDTEKLRCTWMRTPNARCGLKYCAAAISILYDQDVDAIKERGRVTPGDGGDQHCPAEEAPYLFKCPRCAGSCTCSLCRKKWGLPPMSRTVSGDAKATAASSSKAKSAPVPATKKKAAPKATPKADPVKKASPKVKTSAKAAPAKGKVPKEKKASAQVAADGKQKTIKSALAGKVRALPGVKAPRQTSLPRPLKAPTPVAAPELQIIPTSLKAQNVWARVWIYETLVRFDFIKVPKATLAMLDKFDLWSHNQVQVLLERILVALAGMSSINNGQPKARLSPAIKAYRSFGDDLKRGEPWSAAKTLVEGSGHIVEELPHVQRDFAVDTKEAAETPEVDSGPTLLGSRLTRTRRAAEVKALERVKAQSLVDYSRDFLDEESGESDDDRSNGRGAWNGTADGASGSEDDEDMGPRRPGRQSARQPKAPLISIAIEGSRRSHRQRSGQYGAGGEGSRSASSGRQAALRARDRSSSTQSQATGTSDVDTENRSHADQEQSASPSPAPQAPKQEEPIAAPEMEEKVAILCALLEAVLQTSEVADELKDGSARLPEIERAAKDELKATEKEWEEERRGITTSAPSMLKVDEFAKWKKDKEKRERNHRLRVLDVKMNALRQAEANKLRTGPLGVDADGRTFWQLTEFNEQMPRDTSGRWAWCVLVHGQPMTKHAPPADAMPKNAPNISPLKQPVDVNGGDDGARPPIAPVGTPSKAVPGSPVTPRKAVTSDADAASDSSGLSSIHDADADADVFMGTNYPPSFKDVVAFLRYRCAQREYEELKEQQEAEKAGAGNTANADANANGSGSGSPAVSAAANRRAKKQLKEQHDARKVQVESLCKKLEMLRGYYLWHIGEPDETIEV